MAFNPNSIKTKSKSRPPLMLVYAKSGVGKSSFLKSIKGAFVLDMENKLNNCDSLARFVPSSLEDVMECLTYIYEQEDKKYSAIGIDSLDWLEAMIHKKICKDTGAQTITDPYVKATGYGNGYIMAANMMKNELLPLLEKIRDKHNMPIVMVCHAAIVTSNDPDIEPYDTHELKLHDKLRSVVSERVEAKVYAKLDHDKDQNGNLIPTSQRLLIATPQKGVEAKNNLFLPDVIPISYSSGWSDFVSVINTNHPTN